VGRVGGWGWGWRKKKHSHPHPPIHPQDSGRRRMHRLVLSQLSLFLCIISSFVKADRRVFVNSRKISTNCSLPSLHKSLVETVEFSSRLVGVLNNDDTFWSLCLSFNSSRRLLVVRKRACIFWRDSSFWFRSFDLVRLYRNRLKQYGETLNRSDFA
jgi:hypothetical protein